MDGTSWLRGEPGCSKACQDCHCHSYLNQIRPDGSEENVPKARNREESEKRTPTTDEQIVPRQRPKHPYESRDRPNEPDKTKIRPEIS